MLDLILLEKLIIEIQHGAAGIAEHMLHLFFLQTPDYDLGTG
jgi:hypothetical protein